MSEKIYKVEVHLELRADGGLRVWSPNVRGFRLSHSDPKAVIDDIIPALTGVLSSQLGGEVCVREISSFSEVGQESRATQPYPTRKEYATELRAS